MHAWARERVMAARVARLATTTRAGRPHIVPVVFAVVGERIWTAVDAKPKSTRHLQRLTNIAANPDVSLLVDHYEDEWSALWWVRLDGRATVVELQTGAASPGLAGLVAKYPQYQAHPLSGPFIRIDVERWSSWSAT